MKKLFDLNFDTPISIIGDVLIDEYYKCTKIKPNPEDKDSFVYVTDDVPYYEILGGCGNILFQLLQFAKNINFHAITNENTHKFIYYNDYFVKKAKIPIKKRIVKDKILFRYDIECDNYDLSQDVLEKINDLIIKNLNDKITIFSDYNKGIFTYWNYDLGKINGIKLVDPKISLDKWKNCDILKLNRKECFNFTNIECWKDSADYLQNKLNCNCVIITDAEHQVNFKVGNKYFEHFSEVKEKANNVSGAGDIFISFLALLLSEEVDMPEAIETSHNLANLFVNNGKILTKDYINEFIERNS